MAKSLDQRFGEVIRAARERAGKRQEDSPLGRTYLGELERGLKTPTLETIVRLAADLGVSPGLLVEEATAGVRTGVTRGRRDALQFLRAVGRSADALRYASDGADVWSLDAGEVADATREANRVLVLAQDVLGDNGIDFFPLLGTRNLGSFVGAVFGSCLARRLGDRVVVNPHQDGYPDLCAMTKAGMAYAARMKAVGMGSAKSAYATFPEGGIEIKTTCGSVPTPAEGKPKPQLGDSRLPVLTGADWKAHHRETNNLLGLFWDFVDGAPTVLAAFYRNDLTPADWGAIVMPKLAADPDSVRVVAEGVGGSVAVELSAVGELTGAPRKPGRTTSVSIMTREAVRKMARGWLLLPADPDMLRALGQKRVFDLSADDLRGPCPTLPDSLVAGVAQPGRSAARRGRASKG